MLFLSGKSIFGGNRTSLGTALVGESVSAVRVSRLSQGRWGVERIAGGAAGAGRSWLTATMEVGFMVRHLRLPETLKEETVLKYIKASAGELMPLKDDTSALIRCDGVMDPDRTTFPIGISPRKLAELVRRFNAAGIDTRRASGLIPSAAAMGLAADALESRAASRMKMILHLSSDRAELACLRGGRPVFFRETYIRGEPGGSPGLHPKIDKWLLATEAYFRQGPQFGSPEEIVLIGEGSDDPAALETVRGIFQRSQVRLLDVSDRIISESMGTNEIRHHALAIGAALAEFHPAARRMDFLHQPAMRERRAADAVIFGCATAMLALASVTANVYFLERARIKLAAVAQNQKTIDDLRRELARSRESILPEAERLLAVAGGDAGGAARAGNLNLLLPELLDGVAEAVPAGVTLERLTTAAPGGEGGAYAGLRQPVAATRIRIEGRAGAAEDIHALVVNLNTRSGITAQAVSIDPDRDSPGRAGGYRFAVELSYRRDGRV